ncbi:metallophosphoesterase family protein [Halosimplex sp. J119]
MAKQPVLVRSADDEVRVDASFPNGRYTFSLRSGAADLLGHLGYRPDDAVPWDLFEVLAIVGDVWLPNTNGDIADDLAVPDTPTWMDDEEAATVSEYLAGRRVSGEDRERLAAVLDSSALGDHFSVADFDSKSEWVEQTASLVSDAGKPDAAERSGGESTADGKSADASLLHIGKATLGRRNMGRAARVDDYLDAFAQAIDVAKEQRVDAVVQTGRLFQRQSPDRETVSGLQTQLKRLQEESIPFYLVCGPKERELRSTVLKSMETSGLLTPIGGQAVEVGDGVTLVGIDADSGPEVAGEALGDPDSEPLVVACGDADLTESDDPADTLVDRLPTRPAAIVAGKHTDPVRNGRAGVPLLDPGSTEHVLSKSTIDEEPPARGVDEYSFSDGDLAVTRHELDVRPFSTFEFEITDSTTVESIAETLSEYDLDGQAVLARLVGSGSDAIRPSRESVQSLLTEKAHCARVYDDRSVSDDAAGADPDEAIDGDADRLAAAVGDLADLVAALEAADAADASEMETDELADSYAVLSKAKSEIEDLRKAARDELTARVEPNETITGEMGAVASTRRQRRSLRDTEEVQSVLGEHGVPIDRVTSVEIDSEKVEDVVETADDIAEDDVFEVTESEYVRRQEFDPEGGIEPKGANEDEGSSSEGAEGPHKVYLGDGASIGGWTPVDGSVVEEQIVPLVNAHSGGNDDETISVNFGSDVSISGWNQVDASVVRERIVPLVERHRVT